MQQLRVSTTSKPNLEGRVGRSRPSCAPCASEVGSRFPAISSWRCSSTRLRARRRPSDVRSYVLFTCFVCRSATARGVFGGRSRPSTSVGLLLVRAMASLEERCDARLSFRRLFRVRSGRLEDLLPPLVHQASCSACHVRVGMVAKPLHVGGDHGLFQRALAEDEGGKVPQRFDQLLFAARFAFQHLLAPPHLFFAVTECAFSAQDHHVLQVHDPRRPSVPAGSRPSPRPSLLRPPPCILRSSSASGVLRHAAAAALRVASRIDPSAPHVRRRWTVFTSHVQQRTDSTGTVVDVKPKVDATKGGEGYKSLTLLEVDAPKSPNTGTLGKISSRFFLARLNMPNSALR